MSSRSIREYEMIVDLIYFLDLPKLTTISYGHCALQGEGRGNRKTIINGHESYDNTLIMKSMFEIELK